MPQRKCKVCSKSFYVAPGHLEQGWGKYCSQECYDTTKSGPGNPNWKGGPVVCICLNCGKSFNLKQNRIKKGEGKYCSRECRQEDKNVVCTCMQCDKEFSIPASHHKRGGGVFCSRRCMDELNMPEDNCVCVVCGSSFYVKPSELARPEKFGVGSFCSVECKAKFMSGSPTTTTGTMRCSKGGMREDLGFYVRSSWEANYARYLTWLVDMGEIERWEYEPDTFEFPIKRGAKFYTPDFKIVNNDGTIEYHELKGYMDQKSKTKLKRMVKYYPDIKVVLIDSDSYRALSADVKDLIPNWEHTT